VDIPKGGASGAIIAQAGRFGGWSLYLLNASPLYIQFPWPAALHDRIQSALAGGKRQFVSISTMTAAASARRNGTLYVNDRKSRLAHRAHAMLRILRMEGSTFGADEARRSRKLQAPFKFSGAIYKVTVEQKAGKGRHR